MVGDGSCAKWKVSARAASRDGRAGDVDEGVGKVCAGGGRTRRYRGHQDKYGAS